MTTSTNKDTDMVKIGGISALLAAVCYFITFTLNIFVITTKVSGIEDMGAKITAYNDVLFSLELYGGIGLLGTILLVPATLGLYQLLQDVGSRVQTAVAAMCCGVPFLVVSYAASLMIAGEVVPSYLAADTTNQQVIIGLYNTLKIMIDLTWSIGSTLTLGVATGLFAYFSLQKPQLRKRIAQVGVLGGLLSLVWLTYMMPFVFFAIAMVLGAFLSIVWLLIMGLQMVRPRSQ